MSKSRIYYWLGFIAFVAGYMILNYMFGALIVTGFTLAWIGSMLINAHVTELQYENNLKELRLFQKDIDKSLEEMKKMTFNRNPKKTDDEVFVKRSDRT